MARFRDRLLSLLVGDQSPESPQRSTAHASGPTAPSRFEPAPVFDHGSHPARWDIPVLEISYYPSVDGQQIDTSATGDVSGSVAQIRNHVAVTGATVRKALMAGSVYHGYRDQQAAPSLRYHTVEHLEFLEPLPTWNKPGHQVPMTDYNAIMDRVDIASWVARGVKQVWIWGYHGGVIDLWESNMAGPHGDISNSDRDPTDLPVLDRTYTVYHYNYGRGPSEAVEDHMHQIEALFRELDRELFWDRFVGPTPAPAANARCGWAHYPPNGVRDYDWTNRAAATTDIEDWHPDGGPQVTLDCRRWNNDSLTWFVYWMQNLPGADNGIEWNGSMLSNWWEFIYDLDAAIARGLTLRQG